MTSKVQNSLASTYQKKSDKEHILDNPDTYIGSIENVEAKDFVFDSEKNKIVNKTFEYIPGLYKLFDEGIVNCRDHVIRMDEKIKKNGSEELFPVSQINITIENNTITFRNDGNGIDIEKHPEYNIWIPELVFGHLRTSTNYNKAEKKIVGGKNGFGFKLVLIWSTYGRIETVDHIRGLKYVQEFHNNLSQIDKPKITKSKVKPYTQVSFTPDYKRLNVDGLSNSMIQLFQKRVYDIAGITQKNIKVKLNSIDLSIKTFEQYVEMYIGKKDQLARVSDLTSNNRWRYVICISPYQEFTHVSFVNGIYTQKGGKHVDYIMNQICKKICQVIQKKKSIEVKSNSIKEQLMIFLDSTIENPTFDSQTKDYLNTPVSKFGSSCEVNDKIIQQICKLGVIDTACQLTDIKNNKKASKTDGSKVKSIRGIPKLVDANFAGTNNSHKCTLILCEGDSAKAGIISGLTKEDRNFIGVYPMKGKMINVRGQNIKRISENAEFIDIKRILGLENNKVYTSVSTLRYGKILFMTDQDLDGTHIKGLGLNMFECVWPSLLEIDGFIGFMNTPILKATKNKKTIEFYNDGEYEKWKQENDSKGWKIKYYKGLGTSTNKEFKEYFEKKKTVCFDYDEKQKEHIDMVFNKERADDRKKWISDYERNTYLDTNKKSVSYEEFIYKEMIHFSKYDCDRSIPNLMDGLKISQRKILFSAFKKNLNQEIKVAQFSGYVSEHSGYHHGEASLNSAIVGMAQDFVGSNNINLFEPNGQFGTRLQGGKDSASERYIFTKLNKITEKIFRKEDLPVLDYLNDDGTSVEPIYYVPIVPMILVNGSKGIGTGFSTDITCYNINQIITYIENKLLAEEFTNENMKFIPYFKNFKGKIINEDESYNRFIVYGNYEINSKKSSITVTELPIGVWTDDYKNYLEKCIEKKKFNIKDYNDNSTNLDVNIEIIFQKNTFEKFCQKEEKLMEDLKLKNSINLSNMNLFDSKENLKHYTNVNMIIDDHYETRIKFYDKRRNFMIQQLELECLILSNKWKYIQEILNDTIDLRKKTSQHICEMLEKKNYTKMEDTYNYLIKMTMDSVSDEAIKNLKLKYEEKQAQLQELKNTTIQQMWYNDLQELKETLKL
tara:strand:- start:1287 stop:4637 length:3351 start_codon:yes stop_codon:yes gene_type:complete